MSELQGLTAALDALDRAVWHVERNAAELGHPPDGAERMLLEAAQRMASEVRRDLARRGELRHES